MRILLVKTSSMGDLIHTFPALTDAGRAIPNIQFDWVVEESFAEIPAWHPLVKNVIPVALRKWRKNIFSRETRKNWFLMRRHLRQEHYDLVLDAQGLVKSALVTYLTRGPRAGLDWSSAREALASLAYQRKYNVNFNQHAIIRMRSLFSLALGYSLNSSEPDYGIARERFLLPDVDKNYLVFLHGTTWDTKLWPESYWIELAKLAGIAGLRVKISGGNEEEMARAKRIASAANNVDVLPRQSILKMAEVLANAKAVVAVDTGFGHLAAALNVPTVSLYGPTNPDYTGALGASSILLKTDFPCSPCLSRTCTYRGPAAVVPACFSTLPPNKVWEVVMRLAF